MAIGSGALIEVSLRGLSLGSEVFNVFQYEVIVGLGSVTAAGYAEAWWNHVKTSMRGLFPISYSGYFRSVLLKELNNAAGAYGEYAIPAGERGGTRTIVSADAPLPAFNAVGMRLTVGSRVTRPGQKRFTALVEEDVDYGNLTAGVLAAANTLGGVLTADMVLGSPAATATFRPIVVRKDVTGAVTAHQPVAGFIVNSMPTSQVSRKFGRGI